MVKVLREIKSVLEYATDRNLSLIHTQQLLIVRRFYRFVPTTVLYWFQTVKNISPVKLSTYLIWKSHKNDVGTYPVLSNNFKYLVLGNVHRISKAIVYRYVKEVLEIIFFTLRVLSCYFLFWKSYPIERLNFKLNQ